MPRVPVFISAPNSFLKRQESFTKGVEKALEENDLRPGTLGRSDYDPSAPLDAIRRLMNGSCGLICIAFRRTYIEKGVDRPNSDVGEASKSRDDSWLTSPYCQIEPAMAYQIGLPILLWREVGVVSDGLFDLSQPPNLKNDKWRQPLSVWINQVRNVYRNRGAPPGHW